LSNLNIGCYAIQRDKGVEIIHDTGHMVIVFSDRTERWHPQMGLRDKPTKVGS
jgi:hypothetical protein